MGYVVYSIYILPPFPVVLHPRKVNVLNVIFEVLPLSLYFILIAPPFALVPVHSQLSNIEFLITSAEDYPTVTSNTAPLPVVLIILSKVVS